MFLRNPILVFALMLAGKAAGDDQCFCSVTSNDGESGKCGGGGEYSQIETSVKDKLVCQDLCAQDAQCKAFTYFPTISDGNDCYLYSYVPGSVERNNADEQAASCVAATGEDAGFTLLPRKTTGPYGGKCQAPIYSGSSNCGGVNNEPYCVYSINANNLEECKDWCAGRGNSCQGFDFDEGQAERGYRSCYERRFKPTIGYAPTSRKDYTDWFCHSRECNCDAAPEPSSELLCERFLSPVDLIVGNEVCDNTPDKCVATADLDDESCNDWCERQGLMCTKAWNDGRADCQKRREISCSKTGNKRSICQCEL